MFSILLILSVSLLLTLAPIQLNARRIKRAIVWKDAVKWPWGIIPYSIDKSAFNDEEILMLQDAIGSWNLETCVNFRLKSSNDKNWIKITGGTSCYSKIGMDRRGEQEVNLASPGCRYYGLYLHELGHVIGLHHEHIRPDRDKHLEVDRSNMQFEHYSFYDTIKAEDINDFNLPYDLQSIMHYGPQSFSGPEGDPTINVKNKSLAHLLDEVYNKDISFLDAKVVNIYYNCSDRCTRTVSCPHFGYVDQYCQCHTPESFEVRRCRDGNDEDWCKERKQVGKCETEAAYMAVHCRKTCDRCFKHKNKFIIPKKICKNFNKDSVCDNWAKQDECSRNPGYMKMNCKKSCGLCNRTASTKMKPKPKCRNIYGDTRCILWASIGECDQNQAFMTLNCAAACKICHIDATTISPHESSTRLARCVDAYDRSSCQLWAKAGECSKNPEFMQNMCMKSCKICQSLPSESPIMENPVCKNLYDNLSCFIWSKGGECEANFQFMHVQCRKACNLCSDDVEITSTDKIPTTKGKSVIPMATVAQTTSKINIQELATTTKKITENSTEKATEKPTTNPTVKVTNMPATTTSKPVITSSESCRNLYRDTKCEEWKRNKQCKETPEFMNRYCRKTCGACGVLTTGRSTVIDVALCKDNHKKCDFWMRNGECQKNPSFMLTECMLSCNSCTIISTSSSTLSSSSTTGSAVWINVICKNIDSDDNCEQWKERNECVKNSKYMKKYCAKACGECVETQKTTRVLLNDNPSKCVDNFELCEQWARQDECYNNPTFMVSNCMKACNKCQQVSTMKFANEKDSCSNEDNDDDCDIWQKNGECVKNPKYMLKNCRMSCNVCEDNKNLQRSTENVCKNTYDNDKCEKWSKNGECQKNPKFMLAKCALSCKTCQLQTSTMDSLQKNCTNLDSDEECNGWARQNECQRNPGYMRKRCQLSCGLCKPITTGLSCSDKITGDQCERWANAGECTKNPGFMLDSCKKSCSACTGVPCYDKYDTAKCLAWSKHQECEKNPRFMLKNCAKSCRMCRNPREARSCENVANEEMCDKWKNIGECQRNPGYMLKNCAKSCGNCIDEQEDEEPCKNNHKNCEKWSKVGECLKNPKFMLKNCQKSCGICGKTTMKMTIAHCKNIYNDEKCYTWSRMGECFKNPKFMLKNCRKSCGLCQASQTSTSIPLIKCKNMEKDIKCDQMKDKGYCQTQHDYMERNCAKSCLFCSDSALSTNSSMPCRNMYKDDACINWKNHNQCIRSPKFMRENCPKTCGFCKDENTVTEKSSCKNLYNDQSCEKWKQGNECKRNVQFMKLLCPKSCGFCESPDDTEQEEVQKSGFEECINKYGDWSCDAWKQVGECKRNLIFMRDQCSKACGFCDSKVRTTMKSVIKILEPCRNMYDDKLCQEWSANGECTNNPGFMKMNCALSCGSCVNITDDATMNDHCINVAGNDLCTSWKLAGECDNNIITMRMQCALSCGYCTVLTTTTTEPVQETLQSKNDSNCLNIAGDLQCSYWARQDQCELNAPYMRVYCSKACNSCGDRHEKENICADRYPVKKCRMWAQGGECERNSIWMSENCAKSCMVCQKYLFGIWRRRICVDKPGCPKYKSFCRTKEDFIHCPKICENCEFCEDRRQDCRSFKMFGYCTTYAQSTIPECRKTCGVCT